MMCGSSQAQRVQKVLKALRIELLSTRRPRRIQAYLQRRCSFPQITDANERAITSTLLFSLQLDDVEQIMQSTVQPPDIFASTCKSSKSSSSQTENFYLYPKFCFAEALKYSSIGLWFGDTFTVLARHVVERQAHLILTFASTTPVLVLVVTHTFSCCCRRVTVFAKLRYWEQRLLSNDGLIGM